MSYSTTADLFFGASSSSSVFLLSLMFQNSKGDELEVDIAGNVGRHGGQKMSAERAT